MKILFVDRRPVTHAYYRDELIKDIRFKECVIDLAFDLQDAIDVLKVNNYDLVIISLHQGYGLEVVPDELREFYYKHNKILKLNYGQLLGLYLTDKKQKYCYLTVYPLMFDSNIETQDITCISKEVSSITFIDTISDLLGTNVNDKMTIREQILSIDIEDTFDGRTIDEIISYFTNLKENYFAYSNIKIRTEFDENDMFLLGDRIETDKEYSTRLKQETVEVLKQKQYLENKEKQEYNEYLRLMKKFKDKSIDKL